MPENDELIGQNEDTHKWFLGHVIVGSYDSFRRKQFLGFPIFGKIEGLL